IDGGGGNLTLGGAGSEGDIALKNTDGVQSVHIDGGGGNITLGGGGAQGDVILRDGHGKQTIHIDGGDGSIHVNGAKMPTADHVFAADYALPSLGNVASHIDTHGHLPGVPSATDMQRDGVDLMVMNAKLLEKIEELTLYILGQEARLRKLEAQA
ncbi:MAG: hypothetical protein AAFO78_05810, partial [Pseudomonadota bacterium]